MAILVWCLLWAHGAAGGARQDTPPRAREAFERAIDFDTRGNSSAALPLLWEAAGLAPRDADIQNKLGEALERIGALDAAVDAYRAAIAARPAFAKASNNLILALVKAGKAEEAVSRARSRARAAPDDPERAFTLGLAQSDVDMNGAIESFQRVLALAPRHALARYNLALVLYHADRFDAAIAELQRALALEPRPEAYYTLGVIYWHQGDVDRAASALGAAVAAQPDYVDAHVALGAVLKAKRDWKGAAGALRRAMSLGPELPAAHYTLSQVLQATGDERDARRELAEADRLRLLAQQSQEAAVWTAAGTQKLDAGDPVLALDCFRRATKAFDAFAPAHYQMGRALDRLGQREAARAAFAKAQRLNPALVPPGPSR
jgi:tetratricopeptide (TPR) repeat protein